MGEPGPSGSNAGPSDPGAFNDPTDNEDIHIPPLDPTTSPEPTPATQPTRAPETGQTGQRVDIQPDPLEQEPTDDDTGAVIHLPSLQTTQGFLDALGTASLEKSGMEPDDIEALRDPSPVFDLKDPSPLLRSLRHFINNSGSSRDHYEDIRETELLDNPSNDFLSFDQAKRRLRWLSGVVPIEHDMCPETCVAYTGPYEALDSCPRCSTSRHFPGTTTPRKRFTTVPIGPVIQALYGSHDMAEHMHYLERSLSENADHARHAEGSLGRYDDISCGKDILYAWNSGAMKKNDVALQLSIDGAQLRADQPSEAWIFIWIVHNLPPNLRYKKRLVIPGAVVPGPNKPGDIDSFLFPSLYHVAALQREGLRIYDASVDSYIARSSPLIIFATADSLGGAAMSGMVGHSGKFGCRLYCNMPSRHRTGDGHYFPAMNLPQNYTVSGCCHPDIQDKDLGVYRVNLDQKYRQNLAHLLSARTQAEYRARRLEVGLCKQTLFSGLPRQPLPVPNVFTMDIMHLTVLNDPDLFLKLFTGKMNVYEPDDKSTWDWAIFYKNNAVWKAHGESVVRAVPFIPSSFGRAPRDPAKKLNTGYKAWEFQQYIYGLGPTLFRHILPRKYWLNFCKLVAGVRILQRHAIAYNDLIRGHDLLLSFAREFEDLYYQRMESRIHFVRQSIHLLTHMGPETYRIGPLACYAQWTLETAIGNLGREIRQDRDLYANLTQRAVIRAQVNSLCARFPQVKFERVRGLIQSSNTRKFDGGYIFLPRCEALPSPLSEDELTALMTFWRGKDWPNANAWPNVVCRWAKVHLPNGQNARSAWYESSVNTNLRQASCVEVSPFDVYTRILSSTVHCRSNTMVSHVLRRFSFISTSVLAMIDTPLPWRDCSHCQMPRYLRIQVELSISASFHRRKRIL